MQYTLDQKEKHGSRFGNNIIYMPLAKARNKEEEVLPLLLRYFEISIYVNVMADAKPFLKLILFASAVIIVSSPPDVKGVSESLLIIKNAVFELAG